MTPDKLPADLIRQVQAHTGAPWWNGHAYAEYRGFPQRIAELERGIGGAVDDIADVIEWLRRDGLYEQADRLRTIAGRMARHLPQDDPRLVREQAKGWK